MQTHTMKYLLLVDDDPGRAAALAHQLHSSSVEVATVHAATDALQAMEHGRPTLLCLSLHSQAGHDLGIEGVVARTATEKRLPLVVLASEGYAELLQQLDASGMQWLTRGPDLAERLSAVLRHVPGLPPRSAPDIAERPQEITELVFELLGASDSYLDPSSLGDASAEASTAEDGERWVLCVEDDRDFSRALQLRLKQHGINVVRAFEGVEGVQTALTRPAEAVILDYNLPNGRGDFVLRRLKANALTRDIPVIVVSGQKRPDLEREMLHLGAARFFAKPVRFEELLEELQRHLATAV